MTDTIPLRSRDEVARLDILDAWRAVAIVGVMAYHYLIRWRPAYDPSGADLVGLSHVYAPAFEIGRFGVQLFFIISGFVITMTLARSSGPTDFALRRFSRLYPAFAVASVVTMVVAHALGPARLQPSGVDLLTTMARPLLPLPGRWVDGVDWSLQVECWFYVYIGVLYFTLGRRFWVGLAALAVVSDLLFMVAPKLSEALTLSWHLCFFLAGVATWLAFAERRVIAGATLGALAAASFLQRAARFTILGVASPLALGAFSIAAIALIASMALRPAWRLGPLAWLGRISYSLYLLHQVIGVSLIGRLKAEGASDAVALGATVAICVALAALSFQFVEQPALAALRRAAKGWASPVLAAQRSAHREPRRPALRGRRGRADE